MMRTPEMRTRREVRRSAVICRRDDRPECARTDRAPSGTDAGRSGGARIAADGVVGALEGASPPVARARAGGPRLAQEDARSPVARRLARRAGLAIEGAAS